METRFINELKNKQNNIRVNILNKDLKDIYVEEEKYNKKIENHENFYPQKNSKVELKSEKEENDYILNINEKQYIKIDPTLKIKERKSSKNEINKIKNKSIYNKIIKNYIN